MDGELFSGICLLSIEWIIQGNICCHAIPSFPNLYFFYVIKKHPFDDLIIFIFYVQFDMKIVLY